MRNAHLSNWDNIHLVNNTKVSMGQQYPSFTLWEEIFVKNIHIYGARAIFLLFSITKTPNKNNKK